MIKQWFNARELAELSLTNTPKTKFGVILKAQREGWESRPREGKGGGFEYNISSLPPEAQKQMKEQYGVMKGPVRQVTVKTLLKDLGEAKAAGASYMLNPWEVDAIIRALRGFDD